MVLRLLFGVWRCFVFGDEFNGISYLIVDVVVDDDY